MFEIGQAVRRKADGAVGVVTGVDVDPAGATIGFRVRMAHGHDVLGSADAWSPASYVVRRTPEGDIVIPKDEVRLLAAAMIAASGSIQKQMEDEMYADLWQVLSRVQEFILAVTEITLEA